MTYITIIITAAQSLHETRYYCCNAHFLNIMTHRRYTFTRRPCDVSLRQRLIPQYDIRVYTFFRRPPRDGKSHSSSSIVLGDTLAHSSSVLSLSLYAVYDVGLSLEPCTSPIALGLCPRLFHSIVRALPARVGGGDPSSFGGDELR